MSTTLTTEQIQRLVTASHSDVFSLLGMHLCGEQIVIRAMVPQALSIEAIDFHKQSKVYRLQKIHEDGLFEVVIANKDFFEYQLKINDEHGNTWLTHDPYSFLPIITDYDLYLFNHGLNRRIYDKLGAHTCTINNVEGTLFAVWAPSAVRVSVVGDFNLWDGRRHCMRRIGSSGVWEIFLPLVAKGDRYKYEVKLNNGDAMLKADPYAFYAELRPDTASKVWDIEGYEWNDEEWMEKRSRVNLRELPVNIYEVHLGSWVRVSRDENGFLSYKEAAKKLVDYVYEMGYTHIELLPIMEHPFDGSWGYQVTGFFAPTSRYGEPQDFMYFVDYCHERGIGVLLDWVPGHFPKDAHGLAWFDGTALYEHQDPRQGEHKGWGTLVFNYGRHEVRNFLISNALFWMEKYHLDGLRVDAVASMLYLNFEKEPGDWVPNKYGGSENIDAIEFMKQLNVLVHEQFPGVFMIAEESSEWPKVSGPVHTGGLGYGFKWNMGWMNDFVKYISKDAVHRKYHHDLLTFSIMYAFSENYVLPLSHDEVVHGKCSMLNKMPGDYWQKFAGLRAAYGYFFGHPGKKLLFMGGEFGQFIEWKYYDSLDWHLLDYDMHAKLHLFVKDLNKLYKSEPALYELDSTYDGFEWVNCDDAEHSVISFIRKGKKKSDLLLFIVNFTPAVHDHYRIGVPFKGFYKEVLNSDSEIYGGSNVGNSGGMESERLGCQGKEYSVGLRIPPLSVSVFKYEELDGSIDVNLCGILDGLKTD